jgi:hypothetical protein
MNATRSGSTVGRQAGKNLPVELGVLLPGLPGDHAAISNGLLVYKRRSSLLGFEADVFVAGDALAFRDSGGGEYLDAMADSEDPFLLRIEFAHNVQQAPIIAQVFGSATAQNKDGVITTHIYLIEREVGLQTVAGTLDVGIPPRLKVVHYQMEAANRRSSNGDAPFFLSKAMNGIKRLVGFAGISGND